MRILLMTLIFLAGCSTGEPTASDNASAALDSTEQSSTESALIATAATDITIGMTGQEAAAHASGRARQAFSPAGCVTANASGATVSYTLKDCTGPWGLMHVTGTVAVSFDITPTAITAGLKAVNLQVNGATLNLDSSGQLLVNGFDHTLTVSSTGSGVGSLGTTIARSGMFTLTWNSLTWCGTLDGSWSTDVDSLHWSTAVSGYARCGLACPAAGGKITHTLASGVGVVVDFNGGHQVQWSTTNGKSGTLPLFCL